MRSERGSLDSAVFLFICADIMFINVTALGRVGRWETDGSLMVLHCVLFLGSFSLGNGQKSYRIWSGWTLPFYKKAILVSTTIKIAGWQKQGSKCVTFTIQFFKIFKVQYEQMNLMGLGGWVSQYYHGGEVKLL